MSIEIRILGADEGAVLSNVAPDVFDAPVHRRWSAQFVADPRHHLAVALADGLVVGMASAVHYVHPDKPPELWINEVGVAPTHQGQGIGRRLLHALFVHGRTLECTQAWVATSRTNTAARRLYADAGGVEETDAPTIYTFPLDGNEAV